MVCLQPLLSDGTNLVEIYVLKGTKGTKENKSIVDTKQTDDAVNQPASIEVINVDLHQNFVNNVKDQYKNWKVTSYVTFHKNDMTYVYDLSNDNQIVYTKYRQHGKNINKKHINLYAISYNYCKLPTHIFPCLNDLDNRCEYTLHEVKLTNRLSLIIKEEDNISSIYMEYRHSHQVEIAKIEEYIQSIVSKMDIRM
jgi:hypothetical protein